MPRARIRIDELLKWQTRHPARTLGNVGNANSRKGFPSGGPGGYLAAEPVKLNRTLFSKRLPA